MSSAHGGASTISRRPRRASSCSRRSAPAFPACRRADSSARSSATRYWQPINRQWSFTARAEAGAVIAGDRNDIPVGAAVSHRRRYDGARLRVRKPRHQAGRRGPARALLRSTSVEVTRWISDAWGIAAFVDAGNAFDDASDFRLRGRLRHRRARENADRPVPARRRLRRAVAAGAAALFRRRRVLTHELTGNSQPFARRKEPASATGRRRTQIAKPSAGAR